MYSFSRFKTLLLETQLHQLSAHGVNLDLAHVTADTEAILFSYNHFYVELVMKKITDDILFLRCFRGTKKLAPYLHQIDISEITDLIAFGR